MLTGKRYHKDSTDSTQEDARRLISEGRAAHGDICTASFQHRGRGRIAGRVWEGEKNQALMMTLILEKSEILSNPSELSNKHKVESPPLSLILGLALSLSIEKAYGLNPLVKWPNDIYLKGKKAAGILCESEKQFFLCGMGINLNQEEFPLSIQEKAISLKQALGHRLDQEELMITLKNEIFLMLKAGPGKILSQLTERLCWLNEEKTLLLGDPENKEILTGFVRGLHSDGALLIESSGVLHKIYSAEFL